MEQIMKAELPSFVKMVGLSPRGDIKIRVNPYCITSYAEAMIGEGLEIKKAILFRVAGAYYFVDMTIEEADKMMEDIDRSLSFKENG